MEYIEASGESPGSRFGQIVVKISKDCAVLFGGAKTIESSVFKITDDLFLFNMKSMQ